MLLAPAAGGIGGSEGVGVPCGTAGAITTGVGCCAGDMRATDGGGAGVGAGEGAAAAAAGPPAAAGVNPGVWLGCGWDVGAGAAAGDELEGPAPPAACGDMGLTSSVFLSFRRLATNHVCISDTTARYRLTW